MADNKTPAKKLIYESQESLYEKAVKTMNADKLIVQFAFKIENYLKAAEMFDEVGEYQDAPALAKKCRELAEQAKQEEKEYRYQLAAEQKKAAKSIKGYEKAEKMFQQVMGYKDAERQAEDCFLHQKQLKKKAKVKKAGILCGLVILIIAAAMFFSSNSWKKVKSSIFDEKIEDPRFSTGETNSETEEEKKEPTIETAVEGEQVTFGDHLWSVLKADDSQIMMIMLQAEKYEEFRHTPYNETLQDVTWEECSLRKWLNGDFLESHFTDEEQMQIMEVEVNNDDNELYGTSGGNKTKDKVFLLSIPDIETYKDILSSIRMNTWLRSPGNSQNTAAYMSAANVAMEYGYPVDSSDFYTCPVICVSRK